ncbi:MAG: coenzyme F420 hydrogenase [Desulfurococcales archaeon ex4484_58]|nr:MAG: coenzyme F420 hydrogenase [Desulfurococcales archaeon ex4484_58]
MIAYQPIVLDPDKPLGNYIVVYDARTRDQRVRERKKTGGGAVTSFVIYLIEKNIVDAVVVARRKKGLVGEIVVARSAEEILSTVGNRWSVVPYTLKLREILSSSNIRRVVFVGLPCQAQFLKQMKMFPLMESDFSSKIYLIISLFCMGTYAIEGFIDYMKRTYSIKAEDIVDIHVAGDKLVVKHSSGVLEIPISETLYYLQHGCLTCPDYTGVFSDLSAGMSSKPGYTLLIVRNKLVDKLLHEAETHGYLELEEASTESIEYVINKSREKMRKAYEYLSHIL